MVLNVALSLGVQTIRSKGVAHLGYDVQFCDRLRGDYAAVTRSLVSVGAGSAKPGIVRVRTTAFFQHDQAVFCNANGRLVQHSRLQQHALPVCGESGIGRETFAKIGLPGSLTTHRLHHSCHARAGGIVSTIPADATVTDCARQPGLSPGNTRACHYDRVCQRPHRQ